MVGRAGFLHRVSTWEKKNKVVEMATALERGETRRLISRSFLRHFMVLLVRTNAAEFAMKQPIPPLVSTERCSVTHYKYVCSFQTTASQTTASQAEGKVFDISRITQRSFCFRSCVPLFLIWTPHLIDEVYAFQSPHPPLKSYMSIPA